MAPGEINVGEINVLRLASTTKSGLDIRQIDRIRVLTAADGFMKLPPVTITAFHATRSAGGSHDYYSEADYFWPNPENPQGPYVNRDGMSNPDNFNDHRHALISMSIMVPSLVAAFLLTDQQKYARHAADHLNAWFVDESTLMYPRLLYSQAIHGVCTGRSYGLIDTLHLVEVVRAVSVLDAHSMLKVSERTGIYRWFGDYMKWMTTHKYGVTEGNAKNNHATCYWLQVASFADLTGDTAMLANCRKRFKEQLLPQMAKDGSFPQELKRTKPYGYSLFNLDQMAAVCQTLSTDSDNLWAVALPDGQSVRKGAEFMYPYVKDKSTWLLKPDVMYYEFWPVRSCAWLFAGLAYGKAAYLDLWKSLDPNPTSPEVLRNLPIRQPLLWVE
jgi:hypothetical protein